MRSCRFPACLLLGVLVLACGSKTSDVGQVVSDEPDIDAASTQRAISNVEAARLMRSEGAVPSTAKLVHIRSGSDGTLDETGRDEQWVVVFWDASTKLRYFGGISPDLEGNLVVDVAPDTVPVGSCGQSDSVALPSSEELLPDARSRVTLDGSPTVWLLRQSASCFDDESARSTQVVRLYQAGVFTQVHYWDDGSFRQVCGACSDDGGCPQCPHSPIL